MNVKNCPRCGKVFASFTSSICEACVKEEEHIFDKVRDFIKENPNKTVKEVAEECDVSVKRIMSYIRDGKIEATGAMSSEVTCSRCGKPILSGRMCEKCKMSTMQQVESYRPKKEGMGFHTKR